MLRKLVGHTHPNTQARREEKARKRQKGFTLIEMLAVVIILVIVAAIGFVVVNNQIEKSRVNTDAANARTIADAVQRYILDHGSLDASGSGGPAKASGQVNANNGLITGGYLAKPPADPWGKGRFYEVEANGKDVTIKAILEKEKANDDEEKNKNNITLKNALP